MRVLVTGGCGFIGAALVRRLASRPEISLRVLDNETLGSRAALGDFGGEFIRADVRDAAAVDVAMTGVDAVVHLAADTRVVDSIAEPRFNFDVNVAGGLNVLEAMRARGVGRLVSASTGGAILGDVPPPVHEAMLPRPISPYGAAKLAMEGYAGAYGGSYGMRTLSLRFSNVYGPGSLHKGSVVAAFYRRLLEGRPLVVHGDGSQVRDFVFIEDLCDGLEAAILGEAEGVLQLGSGRPTSVLELIEAIRTVVAPRPVEVDHRPMRAGEVKATWCDISRARSALGFDPRTHLHDGLARTWAWFAASQALAA